MRLSLFLTLLCCTLAVHGQDEEKLKRWLARYPEADANEDGTLTKEEVRVFREKMLAAREARKAKAVNKNADRPAPTHADVRYGPHERNVFDLWLPEQAADGGKPVPIFLFFHGGGFVAGDKAGFDPRPYLEAGMAAASGNYRFVDGEETLAPAPMEDAARAVQFLRHHAAKWNLDWEKFAVGGSSAGAVIAMWIGYHDDLKNPESEDPVERESSRVACLVPINGPANLDPHWIRKHMGGPPHIHGSMKKMFAPVSEKYADEKVMARIRKSSPWEHVSADDPPTFLIYTGPVTGIPLSPDATTGELVHHAFFGKVLKEKLDAVGVPCEFVHSHDPRGKTTIHGYLTGQFGITRE